jgi:hypothetical protein
MAISHHTRHSLHPEDAASMVLRNFGILLHPNTASQARRPRSQPGLLVMLEKSDIKISDTILIETREHNQDNHYMCRLYRSATHIYFSHHDYIGLHM